MPSSRQDRSVDLHLIPFAKPELGTDDIDLLHRISVELIGEHASVGLYGKIVEAAVSIAGSQFGTMQLLCPKGDPSGHGGELQLLAHHGLSSEAIASYMCAASLG